MQQHQQPKAGNNRATTGAALRPNSAPQLMPLTERQVLGAKAAKELVDLMGPQDVTNPKAFMVGIAAVFSKYHQAVIAAAPVEIASRFNKLTLKNVTDVCDELQDPISRKFERDRAAAQHQALLLEAPARPTQEERDAAIADYETRVKPVLTSAMQTIPSARVERAYDGRHFDRIKADLDARRAKNEQAQAPPSPT